MGRVPMTIWERIEIATKLAGAKISVHQNIEKRRQLEAVAILARDGGRAQGGYRNANDRRHLRASTG